MSTAIRKTDFASRGTYTVAAGQTATLGRGCKLVTETTVQDAGANDDAIIGVFIHDAAAGAVVDVYLYGPVVPVVVGTGGATAAAWAKPVADGYTDAPAHDSSGGTDDSLAGIFLQDGVVGDRVGMMLVRQNRGSA